MGGEVMRLHRFVESGFRRPAAAALAGALLCAAAPGRAMESVCAEVKIEIGQELTLERQAFEAHMRINNSLPNLPVGNVRIDVSFTDAEGNAVRTASDPGETNALFFIAVDRMENIADIAGQGVIAPASAGDVYWLIVPAPGAGGALASGARYDVGASLSYTLGGESHEVEVAPDSIVVKPMPSLALDYFLPADVYGDDAFTPEIEPPVPFALGVRVSNDGHGTAAALRIDSGQPRIVENELGLLVGFSITATEVNGARVEDGLLVDFGDVAPGRCGVGRWTLESSLSGRFIEFSATFSHSDELGGELTSLVRGVRTHRLVRDVLADRPGCDAVRDFLAKDGGTYRVYESGKVDSEVADLSASATLERLASYAGRSTWRLTVPPSAGPLFASLPFSPADSLSVESAVRDDGKVLPSANAWFSKSRPTGRAPWAYALNVFDVNGGGSYRIDVLDASANPQAPVLAHIGDRAGCVGDLAGIGFIVQASDANDTIPSLAAHWLPAGATFVAGTNGALAEGEFFWRPSAGQEGIYPVRFTASDGVLSDEERIRIYVGRPGEPLNADGVPLSVAGRSVVITSLVASSLSPGATLLWQGHPEVLYDVYRSDEGLSAASAWVRAASNVTLAAVGGYVDGALETNRAIRLYQVVLDGEALPSNGVWGVVRREVPGRAFTMLSSPGISDRRLDGEFGRHLAEALAGDDGGPGDGVGDEVHFLGADGSWRAAYLDASRRWREESGLLSSNALADGQGLLLSRNAAAATRVTLAGEFRNDRSREVALLPGWNLVTLTEGPDRTLQQAFADAGAGGPVGGRDADAADRIVLWEGTGSVHRLIFAAGWGAPYDGTWIDPDVPAVWTGTVRPGQPVFYYRQKAGGTMTVHY